MFHWQDICGAGRPAPYAHHASFRWLPSYYIVDIIALPVTIIDKNLEIKQGHDLCQLTAMTSMDVSSPFRVYEVQGSVG